MRFLRALLALLLAPLVWTWDGLRWCCRRAWGIPPALDGATPAEEELQQARAWQSSSEPADESTLLVLRYAGAVTRDRDRPKIDSLKPEVQMWLGSLSKRACSELLHSMPWQIERHLNGHEIMDHVPRVPPRSDYDARVEAAARRAERLLEEAQAKVAQRQRAAESARPRTQLAAITARAAAHAGQGTH